MNEGLGALGALVGSLGTLPYVLGILRGQVKPHLFTWLVWTLVVSISAAGQVAEGAGAGAWATIASGVTSGIIAGLALRHGERQITAADWCMLAGALGAIPLWLAADDPTASVVLVTAIDVIAYGPTFRKTWTKPWEENLYAYVTGGIGFALGLAAIETSNLVTVLYPLTLIAANTAFTVMVLARRRVLAKVGSEAA